MHPSTALGANSAPFSHLRGVVAALRAAAPRAGVLPIALAARPTPPASLSPLGQDDEATADLRAARARERDRIKAIFLSAPGTKNPMMAAHVALESSAPRDEAIAAMAATQRAAVATLLRPRPSVLAAQIVMAGKKRRGEVASDAPETSSELAKQIVAAGRKARGGR
jgi:hypothetical protein